MASKKISISIVELSSINANSLQKCVHNLTIGSPRQMRTDSGISDSGISTREARDALRIHIYDNPHGSLSHVIYRLALRAAIGVADLQVAANFVETFTHEFLVLSQASIEEPESRFVCYARQSCLALVDALERGENIEGS